MRLARIRPPWGRRGRNMAGWKGEPVGTHVAELMRALTHAQACSRLAHCYPDAEVARRSVLRNALRQNRQSVLSSPNGSNVAASYARAAASR